MGTTTRDNRWQALWEESRMNQIVETLNRFLRSDTGSHQDIEHFEREGTDLVAIMTTGERIIMRLEETSEQYELLLTGSGQTIIIPKVQIVGKPN